jgi:hypothetical protein
MSVHAGDWIALSDGRVVEVAEVTDDGVIVVMNDGVVMVDSGAMTPPLPPLGFSFGWTGETAELPPPIRLQVRPGDVAGTWAQAISRAMRAAREHPGTPIEFDMPDDPSEGR